MKRFSCLILCLMIAFASFGQKGNYKKPDYKLIEKHISDPESNFFYKNLYNRYVSGDTTLNLIEYRTLYYGYIFNDSYSAYGSSVYTDSVNLVFEADTLTLIEYQKIIQYSNEILKKFPFNMRDLNTLAYGYYGIGDSLSLNQTIFKINMIGDAIFSSGDGKKGKSAWHVISVSHEYDFLDYLGFKFGGSQSLIQKRKYTCDYLEVADNSTGIEGFYFDIESFFGTMFK